MSGRITDSFESLVTNGGKGFIPFITAGDPDMATTLELIARLAELGATVIELGVPFTDPMADGPVIQRSSQRALERGGVDIASILELVSEARTRTQVPIVLFGYLNPFYSYGIERFCRDAAKAGVDGILVTDIVDREFSAMSDKLMEHELDLISLVAPTTNDDRIRSIAERARGFVYAVSRTGVTGEGAEMRSSAEELVGRVRMYTDLPVAVGFGIGTRGQIDDVLEFADAAVVGSAIVKVIEDCGDERSAVNNVGEFVSQLLAKGTSESATGKVIAP